MPHSDDPSEDESGTLYDPPDDSSMADPTDDESVTFQVTLSKDQAERLHSVAHQLGLPPSLVATRAIELVCNEVVTIEDVTESPMSVLEQYQTQLDLLHAVEATDGDTPSD